MTVRLGAEQGPVVPAGCASSCSPSRDMAENGTTVDRSSTTSPPSHTHSSPSSSPLHNHIHVSVRRDSIDSTRKDIIENAKEEQQQSRYLGSPRCNGYGGMSPNSEDNADVKNCNPIPSPALEALHAKREGDGGGLPDIPCGNRPGSAKRPSEQDGPLDFSVRRRDSVSETFTDDSRASSSLSPPASMVPGQPHATPPSSRLSPEFESSHLYPPHLAHLARNHENHNHALADGPRAAGTGATRSGGASPSDSEPIGQPRTAPSRGSRSPLGSRSPGGSSLGHMGLLPDSPAASQAAALLGQNGSMLGPLGSLSAILGDPRRLQGGNGGKVQRPFKAYPKEVLQMPLGYLGMPGMNPFAGMEAGSLQGLTVSQEELMNIYKQQLDFLKERDKQLMSISKMITCSSTTPSTSSPAATSNGSTSSSSSSSAAHRQPSPGHPPTIPHHPASTPSPFFPHTSPPASSSLPSTPSNNFSPVAHTSLSNTPFPAPVGPPLVSSTSSLSGGSSRKRPRCLPDNQKDEAYWERRRKNNDAAKRSRDARRAKEDEIAIRAALLEQENLKLRVEVAALKTETARLRCMLYNS